MSFRGQAWMNEALRAQTDCLRRTHWLFNPTVSADHRERLGTGAKAVLAIEKPEHRMLESLTQTAIPQTVPQRKLLASQELLHTLTYWKPTENDDKES